jgi:glycosyltransferase involved in cell wall biosynthesis
MQEFISVIIPTHRRNNLITDLLKELEKQDYPKSKYEVIVVSDTKTEEFQSSPSSAMNVKFFRLYSIGADKKRNFGAKRANGTILAFTDDDCIPERDWLKKINKAFERNPDTSAVEGITVGNIEKPFDHSIVNLDGGKYMTSDMAYKKDEFEKIGGFDENYNYFREDSDLAFRFIKKNKKIIFDKNVKVKHITIRRKPISILKELFFVKNDVRLYKKYSKLYKKHFGFICRGSVKQSFFTWFITLSIIISFLFEQYFLFLLFILVIFIFRYFVSLRRKKFNIIEGLLFTFFCFLRDLLFPLFFIYYWTEVKV